MITQRVQLMHSPSSPLCLMIFSFQKYLIHNGTFFCKMSCNVRFWEPIGSISGACMGFIVFNIPGSIAGYYMGSKMGKVRDMKGVCVFTFYFLCIIGIRCMMRS